jgi:hypothetical protein
MYKCGLGILIVVVFRVYNGLDPADDMMSRFYGRVE